MKRILLAMLLVLIASCGKDLGTDEKSAFRTVENLQQEADFVPDFKALKKYVLAPHCIGCHSWAESEAEMLKRANRVLPGDPKASRLYTLVRDGKMPKNGTPLSEELQGLIFDYIFELRRPLPPPGPPRRVFSVEKLAKIKTEIFEPKCSFCHGEFEKDEEIINSSWVVPGRPEESLLYNEVASERMPDGGPALSAEEKKLIHDFIKEMKVTRSQQ